MFNAATCEILFGLSFIFTKSITAQVSDLALISWRFVTAFLFINLYYLISRRRININGRNLKPLTRIAILNPIIYFICETIGIRMTTASESGAFLACIPVVALIMSSLILKEWPSRWQVVGVITTLIGIIIAVFAAGGSTHFSLVGYLILGLAVISYALYCVDVERASQFSSLEITYFMLASGCLTFGLFALSQGFLAGDLKEILLLPVSNQNSLSPSFIKAWDATFWAICYQILPSQISELTEQHPLLGFRPLSQFICCCCLRRTLLATTNFCRHFSRPGRLCSQ